MKRHDDHSHIGNYLLGTGVHFTGLIHYLHGRKHGSLQDDMMLAKELKVLHLELQASGTDCHMRSSLII